MSKVAPQPSMDGTPAPSTPSLKQKFIDLVITPCLVEGEPYAERSRKIAVACLSVMASNAMLVGIPLTLIAALYDPDVGLFITGLTCITCSLTSSFIPYMYLRRTRTMPQWMVDFQLWTTLPSLVSFMLFMHQGPVTIVCSSVALVAILLRVRLWYLYLAITVLGNAFNHIVAGFKEELPGLHEAMFREQYLLERIMLVMGAAALPLTMLGLALHGLIMDFVERADQSDAAITMFLSVAKELVVYNTDGVAEILAANKGKVDENLLEAFTNIQHNLQEYRPHIPDYVIAAATDRLAVGVLGESVVENGDSSVLRLSGLEELSEGSFSDRPGGKSGSIATSETPSSSKRASSSRAASSYNYEVSPASPKKDASVGDALAAHFYGRATTVFVRFVGPKLEMATGTAADRQCSSLILNTCVELAAKHAKLNGGALQYMQGCGLMVSFNAASRVMSHERNACMFAVGLRDGIESLGNAVDVSVHASIVTSPVFSFFAGNRGQLMLTVLGAFMSQHTAIHQYGRILLGSGDAAKTTSMLLMSASTMNGLAMCVTHRLVGEVIYDGPNSSSHQSIQVFQVMSLVRKASTAEEWMYDLRENVSTESSELEEAIRLALAGDFSAALHVIRTSTVQDSVVEYITKRLEACLETGSKFAVSVDILQMW